jgi:hypothetical protein
VIPTIGLIVAIYAVARLLQVPIEHRDSDKRYPLRTISIIAVALIALLSLSLIFSGVDLPAR